MAFFFTFRVCHARDLAWELVNGDDGGGPPVGVYGKVAARNEDGVAHVYYKYLDGHIYYTYIHYTSKFTNSAQPTRRRSRERTHPVASLRSRLRCNTTRVSIQRRIK